MYVQYNNTEYFFLSPQASCMSTWENEKRRELRLSKYVCTYVYCIVHTYMYLAKYMYHTCMYMYLLPTMDVNSQLIFSQSLYSRCYVASASRDESE